MRLFAAVPLLLLFASPGFAQAQGVPADGGTTEVLQSIYIPPVPHAPFSCTLHTKWIRVLLDGSTITLVNQRHIARDDAGRIFEERRLLVPPEQIGKDNETPLTTLQYADPQAHTFYDCYTHSHVCHLLRYNPQPRDLKAEAEPAQTTVAGATIERVDLGKDLREGVYVQGTRITTTIDAGVLGNSKPIKIERQFWYADSLGINLESLRSDPRIGLQSFTVSDLTVGAPNPSVFELPAGYKVVDDRAPVQNSPAGK